MQHTCNRYHIVFACTVIHARLLRLFSLTQIQNIKVTTLILSLVSLANIKILLQIECSVKNCIKYWICNVLKISILFKKEMNIRTKLDTTCFYVQNDGFLISSGLQNKIFQNKFLKTNVTPEVWIKFLQITLLATFFVILFINLFISIHLFLFIYLFFLEVMHL